jgi:methionyl aminopeptidase
VRVFTGHGIATAFHSGLIIPHYDDPRATALLEPGMTFTIEPMLTLGTTEHRMWADNWTAVTADGKLTAQFEHTMVVTDDGVELITVP